MNSLKAIISMKKPDILRVIICFCIIMLGYVFISSDVTKISLPFTFSKSTFKKSYLSIGIIGSSGYVGSRLFEQWEGEEYWSIVGYDRIYPGQASYELSQKTIRSHDVIIYLGGLTGRKMCLEHPNDVEKENVQDIYKLAQQMLPSQILIFASTSAILEGSGSKAAEENYFVQTKLLDTYAASLFRRENMLRSLSIMSSSSPRMIGVRFGTVIGVSSSQRIDLAHMALVCQAFLGGRLRVTHPESYRGFLSMDDLVRALTTMIKQSEKLQRFDIFHLQSFSASISKVANSIASRTGAHIHATDHPKDLDSPGFSLNTSKFQKTFNFTFIDNQPSVISKLLDQIPKVCSGRQSRIDRDSVECKVCGSKTMHTVLDLHTQPLANDFRNSTESSLKCERFPLRLVRCPKCYHTQLSHIVDRGYLFSHYLYQSGTSQSLKDYFDWLAKKVISETSETNGTVLEIACNDGTQLNQFARLGWKTFGVDPARNLAEIARKQGHTVFTGFWGKDDFPGLPNPDKLDAIVAQNVLAHVDNPVEFLRGCVRVMSEKTKLYIQTSQCEMYETGQFDTVYHEHVSFFTAHSFKKIAEIVGLKVIHFEITPIHGRSCLVTFQKLSKIMLKSNVSLYGAEASSFLSALEKERQLGITDSWFYVQYESQAQAMRIWMNRQITKLFNEGHTIVAYGAAAKGMVLLHYLLEIKDRPWNISYVVDDAPLKQNTFCPGTEIPVKPTSYLTTQSKDEPITIIIFAWNFWEEIVKKIHSHTVNEGVTTVYVMLPFPRQKLIKLEPNMTTRILTENDYRIIPWPIRDDSNCRSVILLSHFYNEELLLPYWIRHHAAMFDQAILIDYNSSDRSVEIINREAPETWTIYPSRNSIFEAVLVDAEILDYERQHPLDWKIVLNTPEFLIQKNLRQVLSTMPNSKYVFRIPGLLMSGNDNTPLTKYKSLIEQRSQYVCEKRNSEHIQGYELYSRFIHRLPKIQYVVGRHRVEDTTWDWFTDGFILKFSFTPWPQIINRKLQIGPRIPESDIIKRQGFHHRMNKSELLKIKTEIQKRTQCDLKTYEAVDDEMLKIHRIWREITEL